MNFRLLAVLAGLMLALAGCTAFPTARPGAVFADGLSAQQLFDRSLAVHGGDIGEYPGDINLSTDGRWYALIQRIQPVVSDAGFRITSQERYRPSDGVYAVHHAGPKGSKLVRRTADGIEIHYNGELDTDPDTRRATAMTKRRIPHVPLRAVVREVACALDQPTDRCHRGRHALSPPAGNAAPGFR